MASASSTTGLRGCQHVQCGARVASLTPGAGPDQAGRVARVGQQPREVSILRQRLHHDAGEGGGIDRKGVFRYGDRRQAGADCARRRAPPCAPRPSSGSRRIAAHDRACICWRRIAVRGSCARHKPGLFSQVSMRRDSSTAGGMPMSATTTSPHRSRPGQQYMPRLFARESDRADRRRRAHARAAVSHDAARNVDRDQRQRRAAQPQPALPATGLSKGRLKPDPNNASTISAAPSITPGCSVSTLPLQRSRVKPRIAAQIFLGPPAGRRAPANRALRVRQPRRNRRRHCCRGRTGRGRAAATSGG